MYPIFSQLLTYYCEYTNLVNVVFSLSPHLLIWLFANSKSSPHRQKRVQMDAQHQLFLATRYQRQIFIQDIEADAMLMP